MDGDIVENFFGVYLLYCINPKYKGWTYIGFTTDPNRRIKQHNQGVRAGGALRTSKRGPWEMALIVHGFPNDISALRFEWAWTYPQKSRRLKNVPRKKSKECRFDFCLRILGNMLQTKPWARLPLTVRWLKQEYYKDFMPGLDPPIHMPVAYGPVKSAKVKSGQGSEVLADSLKICYFCKKSVDQKHLMKCLLRSCKLSCHLTCLSTHFLKKEVLPTVLPVEGQCPKCDVTLLWGDLVRQMKGCHQNEEEGSQDFHWADCLTQIK